MALVEQEDVAPSLVVRRHRYDSLDQDASPLDRTRSMSAQSSMSRDVSQTLNARKNHLRMARNKPCSPPRTV